MESFDDDDDGNHRQRLWGAAVFIAILVIVLPFLLDGAGSESQFRRVEKLREEPPSIVDEQGNRTVQRIPQMRSVGASDGVKAALEELTSDIKVGEDDPPDYMKSDEQVRKTERQTRSVGPLTAWVVQAGSFADQNNALAVRDTLRGAGYAAFIRDRENEDELFKVLVGPMISQQSANNARNEVITLLQRDAVVLSYP